jgi:hypothetical protein
MERVDLSPVQRGRLCHLERDDDQGNEKTEERKCREYQEQEACPFSLMDSCHRGIGGNWGKART